MTYWEGRSRLLWRRTWTHALETVDIAGKFDDGHLPANKSPFISEMATTPDGWAELLANRYFHDGDVSVPYDVRWLRGPERFSQRGHWAWSGQPDMDTEFNVNVGAS